MIQTQNVSFAEGRVSLTALPLLPRLPGYYLFLTWPERARINLYDP